MPVPNQVAPAQHMTTWGGVGFTRYEVEVPTTGDRALVLVPDTRPEGAPARLLMELHGRGASHTFGYAGQKVKIAGEFLAAGYVVVSPDMHGQTWGNDRATLDMLGLRSWVNDIWPVTQMHLFGESMGGAAAMNFTVRYGNLVESAFMTSPSLNLQTVWDRGGTGHSDMEDAFGLPSTGVGLQAVVDEFSPFHQAASKYVGTRFLAFSSNDDPVIDSTADVSGLMARIRAAGGDARHVPVGGGHVSLDHYRIDQFVAFAREAWGLTPARLKRWDGARWIDHEAPVRGDFYVGT